MAFNSIRIVPPIIAHRGTCASFPENTLAAFANAKQIGLNWVEFDVMMTKDQELIVIHDDTLDRTTSGKGSVCDFNYVDLKNLDAGSWFDVKFKDARISTLREVIELLNRLNLNANIEIKAQKGFEEITVNKVMETIERYWQNPFQPLISSFSWKILQYVRQHSATHVIGFLMHRWRRDWQAKCDFLEAATVNVNFKVLTLERVKAIKETGRLVLAYTVNDPLVAKKLFSWGVDAVFSDCPGEFEDYC